MTRLGALERAVMDAVWADGGPVTARQVESALSQRGPTGRALAYTTVLTVLSRLERKGLVHRDTQERAHTYRAAASRQDHVVELIEQALGHADDRAAALQHFARSVSPAEAEALRRALDGPP